MKSLPVLELPKGRIWRFRMALLPGNGVAATVFEACDYPDALRPQPTTRMLQIDVRYRGCEKVSGRRVAVLCVQTARCLLKGR